MRRGACRAGGEVGGAAAREGRTAPGDAPCGKGVTWPRRTGCGGLIRSAVALPGR